MSIRADLWLIKFLPDRSRESATELFARRRLLAQKQAQGYFAVVTSLSKCSQCGTELLPATKFCRRCGATAEVATEIDSSELPTDLLGSKDADLTTRRLEPRQTSPDRAFREALPGINSEVHTPTVKARRRSVLIGSALLLLILLGVIASVAYLKINSNSHSRTTDDSTLIYPGSKTIVDVSSDEDRAIQLQTEDPLEKVIAWYEASIKPTKTMRLTSTSVVLKNENVTTTLATEAGKTNILIKRRR